MSEDQTGIFYFGKDMHSDVNEEGVELTSALPEKLVRHPNRITEKVRK